MFEKIVLKRSIDGPPISLGELAEALLFYQNVHLVLDHSTLSHLIESIRMEVAPHNYRLETWFQLLDADEKRL